MTIRRRVSDPVPPRIFPTVASRRCRLSAADGVAKPSPRSVDPIRALSRSCTCLRNSETRKPSSATGTVHRKTVCSVSAYAFTRGAAVADGRLCSPSGLVAALVTAAGSAAPVRAASATPSARFGFSVLV
jgi:hypothetical protein